MAINRNALLYQLFKLYHREAVRFATRLVGNRDNGEEVVQDAYLKLVARRSTTPIDHPKSYLFTATRHAAIDFTDRQNREWQRRVDLDSLDEAHLADDGATRMEMQRELAKLAVYLNALPPPCRQAFVMNKLRGYTHVEIAAHLGISTSMVEKHIVRALLHCRSLLLADGDL